MNDLSTFEEIAALLPPERRERFLSMTIRFQTVPQDDEYLQILEAIGFMTLLWKEVPGEVKAVLAGANPVTETCEGVASQVKDAVIEAIPSYEDLRQITRQLETHQMALKATLEQSRKANSKIRYFIFALLLLIILDLIHKYPTLIFLSQLFQ